MTAFAIGPAGVGEGRLLQKIEVTAAQLFPPEDVPPHVANDPTPLAVLREACEAKRLWVARTDGNIVGFVLGDYKDGLPHVREIDVMPAYGQRGIGTALMQQIMDWARGVGAPYLTLTTFRHLPYNAPFYSRLGFTEIPWARQGPELRAQLDAEASRGLDPARRVAMWCPLRR
jgi:GNAT superfamily N-acetyltransferase